MTRARAGPPPPPRPLPQPLESLQRAVHFLLAAHDADKVLHHLLQFRLDLVRTFEARARAQVAIKGFQRPTRRFLDLRPVHLTAFLFLAQLTTDLPLPLT